MTQPPIAFQVLNEIGIIEQLARNQFERVMPDGLKLPHFSVLNHFVRRGGDATPHTLARAFQVTKGTMTNTLQRLEARGLIVVVPDPKDGRSKRVSITPEGRHMHAAAIAALAPSLEKLTHDVDEAGFRAALPFLTDLRQALDTARD